MEANKENHHSDDTVLLDPFGDSSSSCEPKIPTKVKFSTVHIQEHRLVLGDNPAVSRGVPLTLSWTPSGSRVYSIDEYEERRLPKRRRSSLPVAFTAQQRESIAKLGGSSKSAIQSVGVRVREIQQSREESELDNYKRGMWDRILRAPVMTTRFRV